MAKLGWTRQDIEMVEEAIMYNLEKRLGNRHYWKDIIDELGQPRVIIKLIPSLTNKWRVTYKQGKIVTLLISGTNLYNGEVAVSSDEFWKKLNVALTFVPKLFLNSPFDHKDQSHDEVRPLDGYVSLDATQRTKKRIRHKELLTQLGLDNDRHAFRVNSLITTAEVYDKVTGISVTVTVPGHINFIGDLKAAMLAAVMQELADPNEYDDARIEIPVPETIPPIIEQESE